MHFSSFATKYLCFFSLIVFLILPLSLFSQVKPSVNGSAADAGNTVVIKKIRGKKQYEQVNHLTNVVSVISDRKLADSTIGATVVSGYRADQISTSDYYPFGMEIGDRSLTISDYRYGFNGMEKDDEVQGIGNSNTSHFRQYDPRLGRWSSVDPKGNTSPWQSPYTAMGNNPIQLIDPFGDKEYKSLEAYKEATGKDELGEGDWLTSDRKDKTEKWSSANAYNLQQNGGYEEYQTITQRTAFYGWFQNKTEEAGYETKWAGAAYIIAQQMSLMDKPLYKAMTPDEVVDFANAGNQAIFEDVFDNLRDLYNGPALKGEDATKWDEVTLTHEQRDVVEPIYRQQSAETIVFLQNLAEGKGWRAALGRSTSHFFTDRFPIGGPLKFEGDINSWQDRYDHGMKKAVPFYNKYKSLFNWNQSNDGRIDSLTDPDNLYKDPYQIW